MGKPCSIQMHNRLEGKVHGNPGRIRDSPEGPAMIGSETGHISIKTSCYHQATPNLSYKNVKSS